MIKAIETVYNGYKFRSRLEARWAVFFDALGVKYEYEKEGFDLGGTWYLPDFWLPQQCSWFEVKGQAPTPIEIEKATLLSIYTQRPVHIFYGDVWVPGDGVGDGLKCGEFHVIGRNPHATLETKDKDADGYLDEMVTVPPHIVAMFYRLSKSYVTVKFADGTIDINAPANKISREVLADVGKHLRELVDLLAFRPGWEWKFGYVFELAGVLTEREQRWCQCPTCGMLGMSYQGWSFGLSCECLKSEYEANPDYLPYGDGHTYIKFPGRMGEDTYHTGRSARLIAAYTAARQARFEHGEKG